MKFCNSNFLNFLCAWKQTHKTLDQVIKLSNVTIECFREKSTIGESFSFISMYKIDNAFAVLEAN